MAAVSRVKASGVERRLVGVISSREELGRALRLRVPPDFFELRLDALFDTIALIQGAISRLTAPLIITARHPAEGGLKNLSASHRQELLLQFLPHAGYLDVELRSIVAFESLLAAAEEKKVKRIISIHHFDETPTVDRLSELADRAAAAGADVFKLVTRTDEPAELERLLAFFDKPRPRMTVSAMGVGKLGRASRLFLLERGSSLNYAHLGTSRAAGQLSLQEMRKLVRRDERAN